MSLEYIFLKHFLEEFMKLKMLLTMSAVLSLMACSSPSSSSDSVTSSNSGTSLSVETSSASSSGVVAALPSIASPVYPNTLYATWKYKWYVTREQELAAGATEDFATYFGAEAPARIRWDLGSSICEVSGMTGFSVALWNRAKMGCSVSEGIGYGMLITLFQNDMAAFDSLWGYNKGMRRANWYDPYPSALMPWMVKSFVDVVSSAAYAAALDADIDAVAALILAYYKFASVDVARAQAYLTDALAIAETIWQQGINQSNYLIYPGNTTMWTSASGSGYQVHNLSYFSPVAFRLLAQVDPNNAARWNQVVAAQYAYMLQVQANGAGLLPDWSNEAFEAADPNSDSKLTYDSFDKEAVRVSWRIAWDYYWFQSAEAASVLNTMANFIITKTGGDVSQISAKPYLFATGEASTTSKTNALAPHFVGSYCLMGMAGFNSAWFDNCTAYFNGLTISESSYSYYPEILQMLFSQLLNGNVQKPF